MFEILKIKKFRTFTGMKMSSVDSSVSFPPSLYRSKTSVDDKLHLKGEKYQNFHVIHTHNMVNIHISTIKLQLIKYTIHLKR